MNITILKNSRNKEVINRIDLNELVRMIREGDAADEVKNLRSLYHLMKPQRLLSGRVEIDIDTPFNLPYVCFGAAYANRNKERKLVDYNGLIVLEVNGLQRYEDAVLWRNEASRMPETLMAFLGASGRSVKIVCRGELFEGGLPEYHQQCVGTLFRAA